MLAAMHAKQKVEKRRATRKGTTACALIVDLHTQTHTKHLLCLTWVN